MANFKSLARTSLFRKKINGQEFHGGRYKPYCVCMTVLSFRATIVVNDYDLMTDFVIPLSARILFGNCRAVGQNCGT